MANRTDTDAKSIHGTNPQNLVEKITRNKIYASVYWKKDCFGLSAETLVDKAVELKYVGGMVGEPQKPTEFICLLLKMLQIQPDKEIVIEFIKNDDYKYVRLLGELAACCCSRCQHLQCQSPVVCYCWPHCMHCRACRLLSSNCLAACLAAICMHSGNVTIIRHSSNPHEAAG
eukprot:GHRR01026832.1.p1 GENE.GHRR01026832.1~~GHRR01026832.1.p1  ORF type:complete len:173 (+),score=35.40 GHRR01026832.1:416-934(+)